MSILQEISENLQKGKANVVAELVQKALDDSHKPEDILNDGLLAGMDIIGEKFKTNDVYVPEVLIAARAMNSGVAVLKPHLVKSGVKPIGKVAIGTVKGDQHDIGKNLVRLMLEGKGVEVIDLGANVSAEKFYDAYKQEGVQIVACSSLLTTTMNEMKNVIDLFTEKGDREKVVFMVGGAPITENFCKAIGADYYAEDAATAADLAKQILTS
ncbi:MAG: corrinoid protein [Defluviitaleaceae bacterium]|nr:corrinoid protein [Defluviitaleaceae bacterium]